VRQLAAAFARGACSPLRHVSLGADHLARAASKLAS